MGALPAALPVTYAVLGDDIVFMTGTGTKLEQAVRKAVVAFEVDEIDTASRTGWSVMVTGWSSLMTHPGEIAAVKELGLEPWVPVERGHYVRIRSEVVSGRRLLPAPQRVDRLRIASVRPAAHGNGRVNGNGNESGQSDTPAKAITRLG